MPDSKEQISTWYITIFGIGEIRYFGRPVTVIIASALYFGLASAGFFEVAGIDFSFRYIQISLIIFNIAALFALRAAGKLPEYRGEPAISDFISVLIMLYSPFNLYSTGWILFALALYFALNETKIIKKMKKKLRNEEKFLFFSYFINNIISVIAAIILHIIYGGYRALPLVGIFFGD